MAHSFWRTRANPYAVQPVLIVTKGWRFCGCYRLAADEYMRELQSFLYFQVGKTFRLLPAKVHYSQKTDTEHAAGNVYLNVNEELKASPRNDSTGQRIDFCNWRRTYVLFATGTPVLGNMAGRSAWKCAPAPDNPMEPWGPGVAALCSAEGLEMAAGHVPDRRDGSGLSELNKWKGGGYHEFAHTQGVQHPNQPGTYAEGMSQRYGVQVWNSPMAGWWLWNNGARHFPEEIEYWRTVPLLS